MYIVWNFAFEVFLQQVRVVLSINLILVSKFRVAWNLGYLSTNCFRSMLYANFWHSIYGLNTFTFYLWRILNCSWNASFILNFLSFQGFLKQINNRWLITVSLTIILSGWNYIFFYKGDNISATIGSNGFLMHGISILYRPQC